jgi:hypothetical protein
VIHNDGQGHLASYSTYSVGAARALAAKDLNGDGRIDVAIAEYAYAGGITIHFNLGNGSLGPAVWVPMGYYPQDIALADLDGDGLCDMAVGTQLGEVLIRRGTGGGAFAPVQSLSRPGSNFKSIDAGDLDHDGRTDLVLLDYDGHRLVSYLNQGSLSFIPGPEQDLPASPDDVKLADLDGDGWLDAAVADEGGTASVVKNLAGTAFAPANSFPVGHQSHSIDVADFDGDTIPDLLVSNWTESTVTLLLGQGGMQFTNFASVATGTNPRSAVAADMDGDGRPDIVSASWIETNVNVLRNAAALPRASLLTASLEFGSQNAGFAQTLGVQIKSTGAVPLVLTPAGTDNAEFTVVSRGRSPSPGADRAVSSVTDGQPGNVRHSPHRDQRLARARRLRAAPRHRLAAARGARRAAPVTSRREPGVTSPCVSGTSAVPMQVTVLPELGISPDVRARRGPAHPFRAPMRQARSGTSV